jgi:hypothetical protein
MFEVKLHSEHKSLEQLTLGYGESIVKHDRSRRHSLPAVLVLWLSAALFMTCAATGASVNAQSQDPLQSKLTFLKAKLERYLSHSMGVGEGPEAGNITWEAVSFESCKITWKVTTDFGRSPEMPAALRDLHTLTQASVDLSSIDPARTKLYVMEQLKRQNVPWSLMLELKIRPASSGFKQRMISTKGGQVTATVNTEARYFVFVFNTQDQAVAEDVSRVFAEASNICQARMQRR